MARIKNYIRDKNITDKDLLLGSSYEGEGQQGPIYKTRSYNLTDLAKFMNLIFTVDDVNYNLIEITGDLSDNQQAITQVISDLNDAKLEITGTISDEISGLEERTGLEISLLDTTLSLSIQGVADTLTGEVITLNQKIFDGDTNLSQDLIDLTLTVNQQSTDLTNLISTSIQTATENLTGDIGVVQQAVNDLDTTIGLELDQVNLDIAGALQSAIDAGSLATAAQASIDTEIINRANADGAISGRIDTLDTQFEFSTEDGSIIGASGALNQTINTAASTAAGAVASRVDALETEYVIDTESGAITGLSQNSITNLALTTITGAVALRVDEIETQFAITDGEITGFSEASQTRIDQSISSATQAQFLTLDTVKAQFVFTDGNITNVADVLDTSIENRISTATSAQFQKIDEVATQFVFDANGNVDGVQGSISSTIDTSKQEAISAAGIAAQSKVDTFAAKIVTTAPNGNVTGLSDVVSNSVSSIVASDTSAQFQKIDEVATQFVFNANGDIEGVQGNISSTINTSKQEAISAADLAAQNKLDTFAAKIVTTDSSGNVTGLSDAVSSSVSSVVAQDGYASSGALNTLSSTVGFIPRIYRQNNAPSVVGTPIGSLWFDANNNNKSYVLVAGSPNVWTTVQDQEFASFKSSATEDIETNATDIGANSTRLTNLNATLDILNPNGTVKKTTADFFEDIRADVDANSATATKAENLRIDIEGENGNGGLTASVNTTQEAVGTINGKLSASYGMHVNAGGKVAGLKLLADSTTTSSFIAQADEFGVEMPNGTRVLTVDSSGLVINGSGTFSGNLSAAGGTFNGTLTAGLVDIASNNITLGNDGGWGTVANINFENGDNDIFCRIQASSSDYGDSLRISGTTDETLDSFRVASQALFLMPEDSSSYTAINGILVGGTFTDRWKNVDFYAQENISLGLNEDDAFNDTFLHMIRNASSGYRTINMQSGQYVSITGGANGGAGSISINPGAGNYVFITGNLSKPFGSFQIDHPLPEMKDSHHLIHSFVESPQANNIYRGRVTLENGTATINLDTASNMTEGTWVLLNRDPHVYTSNETDWDHVRGTVDGNILTIECQNPNSTATVSWLVIGERHDEYVMQTTATDDNGRLIVEIEKNENNTPHNP